MAVGGTESITVGLQREELSQGNVDQIRKLGEYAMDFPESREWVMEMLDSTVSQSYDIEEIGAAAEQIERITALVMLETLTE